MDRKKRIRAIVIPLVDDPPYVEGEEADHDGRTDERRVVVLRA